jgi:RimK family alpha-L-glutamate ligase
VATALSFSPTAAQDGAREHVRRHRPPPSRRRTPASAPCSIPHRRSPGCAPGDVALGRLDILPTLDSIEPGLGALDRLAAAGVTVLNGRRTLVSAHDKLATAHALVAAGVPHPRTVHVAPWLEVPELTAPLVLKPRFGSWGEDVIRCDTEEDIDVALRTVRTRPWFDSTGAIAQKLVRPRGYDLRIVVAAGRVVGAVKRVAAHGEWRTNVALGARREPTHPTESACDIAVAAAAAIGGDLVGVDLLPADLGTWTVLEVNGAVDFNSTYTLDEDAHHAARAALAARAPSVRVEPAA